MLCVCLSQAGRPLACPPAPAALVFIISRFHKLNPEPPQDAGLLISRRDHGAHHKAPFNCKYSIVSGWSNPLLDGDCPGKPAWLLILNRNILN